METCCKILCEKNVAHIISVQLIKLKCGIFHPLNTIQILERCLHLDKFLWFKNYLSGKSGFHCTAALINTDSVSSSQGHGLTFSLLFFSPKFLWARMQMHVTSSLFNLKEWKLAHAFIDCIVNWAQSHEGTFFRMIDIVTTSRCQIWREPHYLNFCWSGRGNHTR